MKSFFGNIFPNNHATDIQQLEVLAQLGNAAEYEVFPLYDIPVNCDDEPVHTPENNYCCGDPTCYCAQEV